MSTRPLSATHAEPDRAVLTIGNFDGVHRGHQCLTRRGRELAERHGVPLVAITFEPHPLSILAPQRAPARLTTADDRAGLLRTAGVDRVDVLAADHALLSLSPDEFLAQVVDRYRPIALIEGPSFRFGRGRAGGLDTLQAWSINTGCELIICNELRADELPGKPTINSTSIRSALLEGDVAAADVMLGRPHMLSGRVGAGDARGTAIGFPTANLDQVQVLSPAHGVYAAVAQTPTETFHAAAVNIGPQPTFDQPGARIEAHLIDFSGDLRESRLRLHLLERLRGQVRFASVHELVDQIARDVAATREIVKKRIDEIRRGAPATSSGA